MGSREHALQFIVVGGDGIVFDVLPDGGGRPEGGGVAERREAPSAAHSIGTDIGAFAKRTFRATNP